MSSFETELSDKTKPQNPRKCLGLCSYILMAVWMPGVKGAEAWGGEVL